MVAEQYFLCSKIFLAVYRPGIETASALPNAWKRRNVEVSVQSPTLMYIPSRMLTSCPQQVIASYLASIVGLAVSNEMVENANFTAHHLLRIYGYCITKPLQQAFVLQFLGSMQSRMGWKTADTVTLLKSQWSDLILRRPDHHPFQFILDTVL